MTDENAFEQNPGYDITTKIWWSHFWRSILWLMLVLLGIFLLSVVIGIVVGLQHGDPKATQLYMGLLGGILGFVGGAWAFQKALKQILGKSFAGYRLVLLKPDGIVRN